MRYDAENNKILIGSRELVATARRGVSSVSNCDVDEPILKKSAKKLLERAIPSAHTENMFYTFECSGHTFELAAKVEKIEDCKLWFATEVDSDPRRPKREYVAQVRGEGYIAAYAYAKTQGVDRVKLTFVYLNSELDSFAECEEHVTLKKLESFFGKCTAAISVYAKPEIERVTVRMPSMANLKFPYKFIRDGQSEFVRRAYKSIARGGTLYATAPTGTGKTVSALYPAVRAMGAGKCTKTFYFTPKETTAGVAVECLNLMAESGAVIRAVKITAKDKCCQNGNICRESRELCENSACKDISGAALELYSYEKTVLTNEDIAVVAKKRRVCPYELALTYAELCDVIICDVNYLFDPTVYIRRFFTEGGDFTFLIDEAHNLPDRCREMYSAEISTDELISPANSELLGELSNTKAAARVATSDLSKLLYPYLKDDIREGADGKKIAATHIKDIPFELYGIFDNLVKTVEEEIFLNFGAKDEEQSARLKLLRDYYYTIKKFRSVMQSYDSSYEAFFFLTEESIKIKLFCIDTGTRVKERLSLGRAAVFFSATLTPLYYYRSMLGGDGTSDSLEVDSPFDSEQLSVSIMDSISTRYSEREDTLAAVCRAIAATVSAKRGNYMIFSPSFAYSDALAKSFSAKYPKIKVLSQRRDMTKKEKEAFLSEFSREDGSYLIGFCVMGGIYSEGIDLAGDSLIGAVIVGIGMPALSYEREAICAYYDEKYEEGKQFSYIYPGMNRVLQAAGRVIRREDDRGVIVLIDDRFADPIYKKIIPKLWRGMKFISDPKTLRAELDTFWQEEK